MKLQYEIDIEEFTYCLHNIPINSPVCKILDNRVNNSTFGCHKKTLLEIFKSYGEAGDLECLETQVSDLSICRVSSYNKEDIF